MTREEIIKNTAQNYIITDKTCGVGVRTQAFIDGAKWADGHPISPWHSVADGDLPPIDKVILCTNGTDISLGVYNRHFYDPSPWKDCERLSLVKYWMEIPKLPTE